MDDKKYILTIAGLDPSSGAGITSDIKTFESFGLYGLSVCTAVTVQNDVDFRNCVWIGEAVIIQQIETLFERFEIPIVKIGIIESWEVLLRIQKILKKLNPQIVIVLDPILKASAGFNFHSEKNYETFNEVLNLCDFITPNYDEIKALFSEKTVEDTIDLIAQKTNIYLKGGHRKDKKGWDEVYHSKIVMVNIPPISKSVHQKHGSGCVLSAALAANFYNNLPIEDKSRNVKKYIEEYLNSDTSLLGRHKYI
ncbi:hydroxymethylpyrimidine/phosphomethylpyrimidine kinase [Tenacibaculum sp. MAR_2009_124]|uniref:hydroxymethylpyrimidine/phosphomethylpyrimidine kinase n=1 Tax=Tenacibaculum sp. MAR_2009_124 TaxID=1250059 RepID=UPI000894F096|nr:hydroxymethylpyrimidine/phosphomethylpyrimidine kinase [Tenacibaculum sp. MAR_2009_124]SEB79904.1 hydroxymethylpyrimidine/phosphomethylpyrimidine kinase [Tenacibaculum sp. MAR_2009_124]